MGTEIVRPSSRSTVNVSSETDTRTALVGVSVASTEFVPFTAQQFNMLAGDTLNLAQLLPAVA